jgi:NAD(P)-dependent dehydrogenase (short-subunit alcohol dehydrogenase family)
MNLSLPQTPSLRLDGKRALVTGASRGIGLACAAALAGSGAHVTLVARSSSELAQLAAAIKETGGVAETLPLDIMNAKAVRSALKPLDPFDILVNAAGCNRPRAFLDATEEEFDAVMDLNVKAAFFVTQTVAAGMAEAKLPGSIIHISSQMGHVGGALRSAYCASKWALEGMTKAVAIDLAAYGIRINTIGPTFIETALTAKSLADPAYRDHVLEKIKLGRLGRVEDLMGAVVFLASDASALMTGTSMLIDGGWTAG